MRLLSLLPLIVACATIAQSASGQLPRSAFGICASEMTPVDRRIEECTNVVATGEPKSLVIEALSMRGYLFTGLKQYDRAVADFSQAIALKPRDALLYVLRGIAHAGQSQHDRAIADYDQAIKLKPKFANAFYNRGIAHRDKGQHDRAIADFDQAIKHDPSNVDAYHNRGFIYASKQQYDRAIADYDQVIKLKPDYADAYQARGSIHAEKRQYERAVADFGRAIKLQPNLAENYNARCWTSAVWGKDLDQALADCSTAIKLDPNVGEFFDSRAMVHLKAGRFTSAEQDYAIALGMQPGDPHYIFGRGIARLRQGNVAGNADLTAARKLDVKIDATFAEYGIKP